MGNLCLNSSTEGKGLEHGSWVGLPSRNLPNKKRWNWESQAQMELKLARIMKVNKRLYKYIGHKRKKAANIVPLLSVRKVI